MISVGAVGTENSKEIEVGDGNRVNGRGNVKTVALELRLHYVGGRLTKLEQTCLP